MGTRLVAVTDRPDVTRAPPCHATPRSAALHPPPYLHPPRIVTAARNAVVKEARG